MNHKKLFLLIISFCLIIGSCKKSTNNSAGNLAPSNDQRIVITGGIDDAKLKIMWNAAKTKCFDLRFTVANEDKETGNLVCVMATDAGQHMMTVNFNEEGYLVTVKGSVENIPLLGGMVKSTLSKYKEEMETALKNATETFVRASAPITVKEEQTEPKGKKSSKSNKKSSNSKTETANVKSSPQKMETALSSGIINDSAYKKLWGVAKSKCFDLRFTVANEDKETGNLVCVMASDAGQHMIIVNFNNEGFLVTAKGSVENVPILSGMVKSSMNKYKTEMENSLVTAGGKKRG